MSLPESSQPPTTAKGKSGKGEGQTKQEIIKEDEETGKTSGKCQSLCCWYAGFEGQTEGYFQTLSRKAGQK